MRVEVNCDQIKIIRLWLWLFRRMKRPEAVDAEFKDVSGIYPAITAPLFDIEIPRTLPGH
jgi:hypothetical protein